MKIGLAVITKYVGKDMSIISFLENARKYGRKIDKTIIVYSHGCDMEFVQRLNEYSQVELIKINRPGEFENRLKRLGVEETCYRNIAYSDTLESHGLVEYSKYRNIALIQSLLDEIDVLFFVDTDVYPKILVGEGNFEEVDFFGTHLSFMEKEDVYITTSDYSGYYIIPPMNFECMEDFFEGLQKKSAVQFVKGCTVHDCLSFGKVKGRDADDTDKLLGGNLAIKTSGLGKLAPFFSSTYEVGGQIFLTRGEDTLMGICARESGIRAIDMDFLIFHDTYGDFPKLPNIREDIKVKDRFYYACMGWIGRNVFLNYMNGCDYERIYHRQRDLLEATSCRVATYLGDDRFRVLPRAADAAYMQLGRMIKEYDAAAEAFNCIVNRISGGESFECSFGKSFSAGGVR